MARDAERAVRLAAELKSREALALVRGQATCQPWGQAGCVASHSRGPPLPWHTQQLRRELDMIAQARRKVELQALRSMRAQEEQQLARGDRFWGVDAYLRNVAKGEECVACLPLLACRGATSPWRGLV